MIPKSIIKEVKQASKDLDFDGDFCSYTDSLLLSVFKRRLNKIGYKTLRGMRQKGSFNTFIMAKDGYIVKDFGGFEGKRMPGLCVETYFVSRTCNVVIQPLVDTKSKTAKQLIKVFLKSQNEEYYDFHDKNLGVYKKKLVCFDW